ncbi:MAG: hypothetical protein EZS28_002090 [Streblomastix strix]|uniref:Uncharacterized protein n=1 Tax=Streblomastix strix TaxID=222440 RepID=A0A5J4X766_9EUKA|nr:MAG: hypothetical protein EZS28_002090 [Streblomastix strix]
MAEALLAKLSEQEHRHRNESNKILAAEVRLDAFVSELNGLQERRAQLEKNIIEQNRVFSVKEAEARIQEDQLAREYIIESQIKNEIQLKREQVERKHFESSQSIKMLLENSDHLNNAGATYAEFYWNQPSCKKVQQLRSDLEKLKNEERLLQRPESLEKIEQLAEEVEMLRKEIETKKKFRLNARQQKSASTSQQQYLKLAELKNGPGWYLEREKIKV